MLHIQICSGTHNSATQQAAPAAVTGDKSCRNRTQPIAAGCPASQPPNAQYVTFFGSLAILSTASSVLRRSRSALFCRRFCRFCSTMASDPPPSCTTQRRGGRAAQQRGAARLAKLAAQQQGCTERLSVCQGASACGDVLRACQAKTAARRRPSPAGAPPGGGTAPALAPPAPTRAHLSGAGAAGNTAQTRGCPAPAPRCRRRCQPAPARRQQRGRLRLTTG